MVSETVIQECKTNCRRAQKKVFDEYSKLMMGVCLRYMRQWEDAEEAMLSGFQNFFKHIDAYKYNGEASIVAYLKKIMVNECLMRLRKRQPFILNIEENFVGQNNNENIIDKLSADELMRLILKLPPGYRTVFNLFILEDYSHKEIAQILGITEGTSKSQLSKAKEFLKKMIIENGR